MYLGCSAVPAPGTDSIQDLAYTAWLFFFFQLSELEKLLRLESLTVECILMRYALISQTQRVFLTALLTLVLNNKICLKCTFLLNTFSLSSVMTVRC